MFSERAFLVRFRRSAPPPFLPCPERVELRNFFLRGAFLVQLVPLPPSQPLPRRTFPNSAIIRSVSPPNTSLPFARVIFFDDDSPFSHAALPVFLRPSRNSGLRLFPFLTWPPQAAALSRRGVPFFLESGSASPLHSAFFPPTASDDLKERRSAFLLKIRNSSSREKDGTIPPISSCAERKFFLLAYWRGTPFLREETKIFFKHVVFIQ